MEGRRPTSYTEARRKGGETGGEGVRERKGWERERGGRGGGEVGEESWGERRGGEALGIG